MRVIVYATFNGLAAASNPTAANLQINGGQLIQGAKIATLKVQMVNLGSQPTTSLALGLSGVQSSSAIFSATVSVMDLSSGGTTYSGSFTVPSSSTSVSYSFNAALNPNQNVALVVTLTPSVQGASLFTVGSTYNLLVSTQPYSKAAAVLTAGVP